MHYIGHSIGLCTELCTDNYRLCRVSALIGTLYEECTCPRKDFGNSEVVMAGYLRGVGFNVLQRTEKIL
jgi:hypothetical protein